MKRAMVVAAVLWVLIGAVAASAAEAPALDVKTERVIVYKDGYCMFVKQATGKLDASAQARIEDVPDCMVLGSFWVTPSEGTLTSLVAEKHVVTKRGNQETEKSMLLQFDPKSAGREVKLSLQYYSPGIRWIPTYRVELGKDGKARLVMQGEILNEGEDLEGIPVDLVVGVPNFRYKEVVSPISLEATLRNLLQQVAPQLMGGQFRNDFMSQRAGEFRGAPTAGVPAPDGAAVPSLPPELAGEGTQDMFVYHVPELTLEAGQRALVPLISAEVPFRHLYVWDVQLTRSGVEGLPEAGPHTSPGRLLKNDVWHLAELTNNTGVPWTTGAALALDGYLPLAQELLTYTSVGAKCQIPLTVAVDVRGTYSEEDTGREPKALRFNGTDYARISKKGTLRVTSYKTEPIDLIVTCQFGGNAASASDNGTITMTDFQSADWSNFSGHPALNPHSTVEWQLTLKPGETKELWCEYSYYLP
jgi:hypothetical protein